MSKPKRITFIIDAWYPLVGGGQEYVREIANRLVGAYGCRVRIITRKISGTPVPYQLDPSVELVCLGPRSSFNNIAVRIWFLIASTVYLFLHPAADVYVPQSVTPGIVGKIVGWCRRRPVVMVVHGSQLANPKASQNIHYRLERWILTKIEYTAVISVAQSFVRVPNVNRDIVVIPNGVDGEAFDEVKAEKTTYPSILFVGRLDAVKGVDILLRAFKLLIASGDRESRLRIVGYGFEEDNLKQLARSLSIRERVDFLGKVTGDDLMVLYKSSWVFVLPSWSEGHPLTLLEAWAARLPVIATDVGDVGQYLIDGQNGRLVSAGDIPGIAGAMNGVLNDPQRAKMGDRGFQLVRGKYTWERAAAATYTMICNHIV